MAKRKKSDERRKHDRITIKSNVFTALGADSKQKCVVLDISEGGLSLRYYEGSELIKQIADEKSVKLDIFVDKGDLCLSQIPFQTVYDAKIMSELPLDEVTIRKRGVKFGRLTKDQRSKLNDLVQTRLTK
ncbi:MAG TPA: PilZ domain-containing protein [Deltaproteobacteria bacterium]|nr:PilZ domain-containing protein [Deltaproteobacteria bacterium]